jgi:kinesin family protein 13
MYCIDIEIWCIKKTLICTSLFQGHTRRIGVKVKPSKNSGTLPLICESISSISVGCICSRNKMTQKGLDSYQEEDLTLLRDRWSEALARRKEYLKEQIQKLINKQGQLQGVIFFFLNHTWHPRWLTGYLIGSIFEL